MDPLATQAEATILLVDDNPANLGVLTQLLSAQSWRVLVAQQGEIGLQIAQRARPDLIVLDVLLPGMDGFAICRRLKADPATAEIPVLFMTVRMEAADKLKGFQAGAVDYITKPFQAEEVLARVTTHLRLRQLAHSLQEQNIQLQQEIAERRQAEAALQRAHVALEQQVAERTAALSKTEALYYISHSLITIEQLPDLLQAVVDKIAEALPADRVTLILCDVEKRQVSHFMKSGPGIDHVVTVSFEELWAGLVGWVLRELKPALSPKGVTDPRESPSVQQRRAETDCGGIMVTPLRYREKTLGAITAINRPDQPDFTQEDLDLMMAMANQAAMTIENTRLLLSLRKARVELEQRVQERTADLIQANADLQAQIAERRRIEEELLTERNLLRTLIDNAPERIYVKDTAGRFVLANTATMMQLNVGTPDQLLGKTDVDFFAPERAAQYRADELAVLQSGRPLINKEESSIDEQTGASLWGLTTKVPVRDAHGQIIGLVGMSRDITELKRAEDLLRANEVQLRAYTQRLEILHAIDQAILAAQSTEAIAQAALGHMRALVPCRWASVAVFDTDARAIVVLAIHANDHAEPVVHASGALEPLQIVDALRRGEVQVVEDTAALSAPEVIAAPIPASDVRSYVNVPLIAAGDLLGILTVGSDHPRVFTPAHIAIAREVAGQIAVAIQNARLFADMSAARAHLQAVSRQLVAVQESERARIARDLHDEIGQMLTGLKLVLAIGTRSNPSMVLARLAEAHALINDLTTRVREISLDLRPAMLDDLGLLPTLLWHVKRYTEQTQIQVAMKHTGLDQRVPPDVEIAVYRLVQEGLTNVARHANVHNVAIWLWRTADSIGVQIKDQGSGFTPKEVLAAHTSSGLAGMIERVRLLGGQLTIESAPGQGTRLTAELPLGAALE